MDQTSKILKARFETDIAETGCDPALAEALFESLIEAYSEPQRCYHTLSHLKHMFEKQDQAGLDDAACRWATWFHDFVYEPGNSQNEDLSAKKASHHLTKLGVSSALTKRTEELIRFTQHHDCGPQDQIAHLFLDSDMSILGEDPMLYRQYVSGIRQEFSSVPRFLFNRGRRAFLKDLLNRDHIFLSQQFREIYEAPARRNLSEELTSLS